MHIKPLPDRPLLAAKSLQVSNTFNDSRIDFGLMMLLTCHPSGSAKAWMGSVFYCIQHVFRTSTPIKIGEAIVFAIAIFVASVITLWSRPDKCLQYEYMNQCSARWLADRHAKISIAIFKQSQKTRRSTLSPAGMPHGRHNPFKAANLTMVGDFVSDMARNGAPHFHIPIISEPVTN